VNLGLVSPWPDEYWNKGPRADPRVAKYGMVAVTGHSSPSVLPINT